MKFSAGQYYKTTQMHYLLYERTTAIIRVHVTLRNRIIHIQDSTINIFKRNIFDIFTRNSVQNNRGDQGA